VLDHKNRIIDINPMDKQMLGVESSRQPDLRSPSN
jgi:hypothetical protein